jgi:hypothetical protein
MLFRSLFNKFGAVTSIAVAIVMSLGHHAWCSPPAEGNQMGSAKAPEFGPTDPVVDSGLLGEGGIDLRHQAFVLLREAAVANTREISIGDGGLSSWFAHNDAVMQMAEASMPLPDEVSFKMFEELHADTASLGVSMNGRIAEIRCHDKLVIDFGAGVYPPEFPLREYSHIAGIARSLSCCLVTVEANGSQMLTLALEYEFVDDVGRAHCYVTFVPDDPAVFFDPQDGPQGGSFWRRARCVADAAWLSVTMTACFASIGGCFGGQLWFCPVAYEACCWAASTFFDVFRTCAETVPSGDGWGFVVDQLRRLCQYAPGDFPMIP